MNLNAEHLDLMRGEVGKFSHCSCGRTGKFSHFSSLKLGTLLSNIYYVRGWTRKNIGWKVHHEQIACWVRKFYVVDKIFIKVHFKLALSIFQEITHHAMIRNLTVMQVQSLSSLMMTSLMMKPLYKLDEFVFWKKHLKYQNWS